jgi:hypothetical protein
MGLISIVLSPKLDLFLTVISLATGALAGGVERRASIKRDVATDVR